MHAMMNPYVVFLTCSMCLLMMGLECVWGLGGGNLFKFSVSLRASKLSFKAFSSRRSSLTPTFVESCVDFEVAQLHVSVLMVRRLPYKSVLP